jgi:hypothetical protein
MELHMARGSRFVDAEEYAVTSADASLAATVASESVDGGEAVGIPSLQQSVGGLAAALSQGTTVAREAARLGLELTRIAWGCPMWFRLEVTGVSPIRRGRRTRYSG